MGYLIGSHEAAEERKAAVEQAKEDAKRDAREDQELIGQQRARIELLENELRRSQQLIADLSDQLTSGESALVVKYRELEKVNQRLVQQAMTRTEPTVDEAMATIVKHINLIESQRDNAVHQFTREHADLISARERIRYLEERQPNNSSIMEGERVEREEWEY